LPIDRPCRTGTRSKEIPEIMLQFERDCNMILAVTAAIRLLLSSGGFLQGGGTIA
jgi:hypothetical protein